MTVRAWVPWAALFGVALGLSAWLGATTPGPTVRTPGARLGPESGQSVQVYRDAAAASLHAAPAAERRWALISPETEWRVDELWPRFGGIDGLDRIGRVLLRVPIAGVQTPTATVSTGQSAEGVGAAGELAAFAVPDLVAPGTRGEAVARVSAARLRAGVPAVVGIVVWGTGDALRAAARGPGVRAVQVLADDGGGFALAPLLPSFTDRATPGADDRPVPRT